MAWINIQGYKDKTDEVGLKLYNLSGYDMSTFIRRYSRYLNEKAMSYRLVAVDFTKMKRGYV